MAELEYSCQACGQTSRGSVWVAIDLAERPDLRSYLAAGTWLSSRCDSCQGSVPRRAALLVTRLDPSAPVVLAVSHEAIERGEDHMGASSELVKDVRDRLGDAVGDVPGPVLIAPHSVVALAASRDVQRDADDPTRIAGLPPAQEHDYRVFMQAIVESAFERRLGYALDHLVMPREPSEFASFFASYPELLSTEASRRLEAKADAAQDGAEQAIDRAAVLLLESSQRGHAERAWREYVEAVQKISASLIHPQISELLEQAEQHLERAEWTELLGVAERLLFFGEIEGGEEIEAPAADFAAVALTHIEGPGREARYDRAIAYFRRELEILDRRPDLDEGTRRASILQNLGVAYSAKHVGDELANQERGRELQEQALAHVSMSEDGRLCAMVHTNLGLNLLELARLQPTQTIDPTEEDMRARDDLVRLAIPHFDTALEWRSFERDPLDWAFTQINLGLAYARLRTGDRRGDLRRALNHYAEAVRGFEAAAADRHVANTLHNMSGETLALAQFESPRGKSRRELIERAISYSRRAIDLWSAVRGGVDEGRAWYGLAHCLTARGDDDAAVEALQRALSELTPDTAPSLARDVARELAELAAAHQDWNLSAEAWDTAAVAAARVWEARGNRAGRQSELHRSLNIFRFAGYALARAGRNERAVEVLELGRARELSHWISGELVDIERLEYIDPKLLAEFR
ncbi:MAG TPA: CpXC domain-containing protein [Anaeromyxobacteraceae bacterium]|nr:CpXC domain-containing protein [Anaeromyxobacteraceae bacterium]